MPVSPYRPAPVSLLPLRAGAVHALVAEPQRQRVNPRINHRASHRATSSISRCAGSIITLRRSDAENPASKPDDVVLNIAVWFYFSVGIRSYSPSA